MTHIITYPAQKSRRRSRTLAALLLAAPAALFITLAPVDGVTEDIKLDDGTVCTVIEQQGADQKAAGDAQSGLSSSVTAGAGTVSSSSTVGGNGSTATAGNGAASTSSTSAGSSSSSSSASAATSNSGAGGGDSLSTASITRPDGTVITRRSDGTCAVTKPKP